MNSTTTATDDYLLRAFSGAALGCGLFRKCVENQPVAISLLADRPQQVVISCS
jgi:hypothetical protein